MPLLAFVWGFIASIIPLVITKIIAAIGVSLIVYSGFDFLFDQVISEVLGGFSAIPPQILQLLAMTGVGVAINSMLSAMSAVIAYKIFSGSFNMFKFGGN